MSHPPPLQHHHQGAEVEKSALAIVFKKWSRGWVAGKDQGWVAADTGMVYREKKIQREREST
ncbi:unnamed protein product [Prunus armeniaca]|uniref:Uncharacterized protein n=1 Tax=Prunus armeniaca TaxID=36596 RepID=A0A6J5XPI0_PRUAR|nr:hypothetical protein GBA52_018634 [Prunus armeniaca]CAB4285252.1 unnamed protein product [Prunus armeniaca]CAB4315549.1 unnamed protein product [Prunus armeniaca]